MIFPFFKYFKLTSFKKIRILSNRYRFKIIELTEKEKTITQLGKELRLSYKRCSDYCAKLEKLKLIEKRKDGKNSFVKSNPLILKVIKTLNKNHINS